MGKRAFMDFLREQRRGNLHEDLTQGLNELVEAVASTGKKGKLVLEIEVKPTGNETGGSVVVSDKTVIKAPIPAVNPSIFFITPENNLVRDDPNQKSFELKKADDPAVQRVNA